MVSSPSSLEWIPSRRKESVDSTPSESRIWSRLPSFRRSLDVHDETVLPARRQPNSFGVGSEEQPIYEWPRLDEALSDPGHAHLPATDKPVRQLRRSRSWAGPIRTSIPLVTFALPLVATPEQSASGCVTPTLERSPTLSSYFTPSAVPSTSPSCDGLPLTPPLGLPAPTFATGNFQEALNKAYIAPAVVPYRRSSLVDCEPHKRFQRLVLKSMGSVESMPRDMRLWVLFMMTSRASHFDANLFRAQIANPEAHSDSRSDARTEDGTDTRSIEA